MNTNQFNLFFEVENACVPLLLYYLGYLIELREEESNDFLPEEGRRGKKQPAKLIHFL